MAVGWALVKKEATRVGQRRFGNIKKLRTLALQERKPWANAVQFDVTTPLKVRWTDSDKHMPPATRQGRKRTWDAVVEIDGVAKAQLVPIFKFIHDKCSHVDGIG